MPFKSVECVGIQVAGLKPSPVDFASITGLVDMPHNQLLLERPDGIQLAKTGIHVRFFPVAYTGVPVLIMKKLQCNTFFCQFSMNILEIRLFIAGFLRSFTREHLLVQSLCVLVFHLFVCQTKLFGARQDLCNSRTTDMHAPGDF